MGRESQELVSYSPASLLDGRFDASPEGGGDVSVEEGAEIGRAYRRGGDDEDAPQSAGNTANFGSTDSFDHIYMLTASLEMLHSVANLFS